MGDLRYGDKVEYNVKQLKKSWKLYKKTGQDNALFKAVFHAFRRSIVL